MLRYAAAITPLSRYVDAAFSFLPLMPRRAMITLLIAQRALMLPHGDAASAAATMIFALRYAVTRYVAAAAMPLFLPRYARALPLPRYARCCYRAMARYAAACLYFDATPSDYQPGDAAAITPLYFSILSA